MKETKFKIDGMSCVGCSKAVTRALKQLPGIDNVEVDFTSGCAVVVFNENQLSEKQIHDAVGEAGYKTKR
jgi:Cu+-exporting ATPase